MTTPLKSTMLRTIDDDGFVCPAAITKNKNAARMIRRAELKKKQEEEKAVNNIVTDEDFAAQVAAMSITSLDDLDTSDGEVVHKGDGPFGNDSIFSQDDVAGVYQYINTDTPAHHKKNKIVHSEAPPAILVNSFSSLTDEESTTTEETVDDNVADTPNPIQEKLKPRLDKSLNECDYCPNAFLITGNKRTICSKCYTAERWNSEI
jgi:hypothetical protein